MSVFLIAGMLAGGAALAAVLWAVHLVVSQVDGPESLIAAGLLTFIFLLEITGRTHWLAVNWRVPNAWVSGSAWRTGSVWGGALGAGLVTEAPYGVLHAALVLGALSGTVWPVVAVPTIFVTGRLIVTLVPAIRNMIVIYSDHWVVIAGREVSTVMLVAKIMSRLTLLAVVVWAFSGAIYG